MTADYLHVDFRPAPVGWRAVWIHQSGHSVTRPMVGWLIQERAKGGRPTASIPACDRDRRVVPAFADPDWDWGLFPCVDAGAGYLLAGVLTPGEHDPRPAELGAMYRELFGEDPPPALTGPGPADLMDAAMHSVWLHGDWRWLTRNMTTEEREAAADAVDRYNAILNDPREGLEQTSLRWWR